VTPTERAARIVAVARANPGALLSDLAQACERSEKWTARVLREAGITFPEAPRTQHPAAVRSPRSIAASNTRQVKRLISDAKDAGVIFRRSTRFFEAEAPNDEIKAAFEPQIRAHAERIFELLFPAPTRSRSKRPVCRICKAGSGCRKKGQSGVGHELECPVCHHACRAHFYGLHHPECPEDKTWNTPDGCSFSAYRGENGEITPCPCEGWPITPQPLKRGKKVATETQQIEIETQETEEAEA
jgi:hypothetical protein